MARLLVFVSIIVISTIIAQIGYARDYVHACPEDIGLCNKCTTHNGTVMSLTRLVCSEYSKEKCQKVFNGDVGMCHDGCNTCSCTEDGIISTEIGCSHYNKEKCIEHHPNGKWECGKSLCFCTDVGIGFVFAA